MTRSSSSSSSPSSSSLCLISLLLMQPNHRYHDEGCGGFLAVVDAFPTPNLLRSSTSTHLLKFFGPSPSPSTATTASVEPRSTATRTTTGMISAAHHHDNNNNRDKNSYYNKTSSASGTIAGSKEKEDVDDSDDQAEEEDETVLYDMEEFLGNVNFSASIINGKVIHDSPSPANPLQSMSNLTQKLRTISTQFEYQLSLVHEDQVNLQDNLEQTQNDRNKLQSLLLKIRHEKENLESSLNETQTVLEQERQQNKKELERLQKSIQHTTRAYHKQQNHTQQLETKCQIQREQIRNLETSSRQLLLLLWKLLQRRIRNWIVFIFPILFRLMESFLHFFVGTSAEGEQNDLVQEVKSLPPAKAS